MDAFEAMLGRRSIGKLGGNVRDADLQRMIAVAVRAPNHKSTRPWRFTIVRGDARVRLGETWSQVVAAETTLTGDLRDDAVRREAAKPLRAPVIVVASTRTASDPVVADEDFAATAAAVQNLLLGAHALGLGAIWRTGAMAHREAINTCLGLEPDDRIVAFVYVGERTESLPPSPDVDASGVVRVLER